MKMKKLIGFLCAIFLVTLTFAGTASAASVTIPLSDFVIFSGGGGSPPDGGDETQIGGHVEINGNIGSNQDLSQQGNPLPGYPAQLNGSAYAGGNLTFGQDLTVGSSAGPLREIVANGDALLGGTNQNTVPSPPLYGNLYAYNVTLRQDTQILQVSGSGGTVEWTNSYTPGSGTFVEGGATQNTTDPTTFALITMPAATSFTAGGADQQVPAATDFLTLAPGTYGALSTSQQNQKVTLSSGNYYFDSISTQGGFTLEIDLMSGNPVNIYVVGDATFAQRNTLMVRGAGTGGVFVPISDVPSLAALIYMETQGNFVMGGALDSVHNIWGGTLYSSLLGNVTIGQYMEWYGAAYAFDSFDTADHGFWNYVPRKIPAPAISLEKFVSVDGGVTYHDADNPTGPFATVGNDVYFKFVVTNTGNVPLTNIILDDPDYNLNLGGCIIIDPLAPGEAFACVIGPITAKADQQTNTATAMGVFDNQIVSDTDDANYFGAALSIDVEKSVSVDNQVTFHDADVPPGPETPVGSDVWFKYVVTNTSNVQLTNVTLGDDTYTACIIPGTLEVGESVSCVIGPITAIVGQHTNTAIAQGTRDLVTTPLATDPANYFGTTSPAIDVEKFVSVDGGMCYHDADTPPGPSATVGNDVNFKFVVTNTGDVQLTNITLDDTVFDLSGCSITDPLDPNVSFECLIGPETAEAGQQVNTASATGNYDSQTFSDIDPAYYFGADISIDVEKFVSVDNKATWLEADTIPGPTAIVGDTVYFKYRVTNTSNDTLTDISVEDSEFNLSSCLPWPELDPNEYEECEIGPKVAKAGQQMNIATATGKVGGETTLPATDPAYYFGDTLSIDIEKSVSVDGGMCFHEADNPPGPFATEGKSVFFKFVVTNTGGVQLSNIELSDTNYDVSGCIFPSTLDPSEAFACVIGPITATLGTHTNTATAEGDFGGKTVSDTNPANYTGVELSIDVEKSVSVDNMVSFHDADVPPGPEIIAGKNVWFRYVVTNTSNEKLFNITLDDNKFSVSGCPIPPFLDPDMSFSCVIGPITAEAGLQTNITVAKGEDEDGTSTNAATDPANYTGIALPAIDVQKSVSVDGGVTFKDVNEAPGPTAIIGNVVVFRYVVTNIGNVPLTGITLKDSDSEFDLSGCPIPLFLDPGNFFECMIGTQAIPGQHMNLATATGIYETQTLSATDPAYYFGAELSVAVEKSVSVDCGVTFEDADEAPGPTAIVGNKVLFKFVVSNTGEVPLTDITLDDSIFDVSDCPIIDPLDPGESFECIIGAIDVIEGQHTNTATVTGKDEGGTQTTFATDPAFYFGADLSIDVEKSVSVDGGTTFIDAEAPPGPTVLVGDEVLFKFVVTNTSKIPLTDITLTDTNVDVSSCSITDPLNPDESTECIIGPITALAGQHKNTATATGKAEEGTQTPPATDSAYYFGAAPAINIEKIANSAVICPGDMVTYIYMVRNFGNDPLSDVKVTDDICSPVLLAEGDINSNCILEPCETWIYKCSANLTEDTTNTATVTGKGSTGKTVTDKATFNVTVDKTPPQINYISASPDILSPKFCFSPMEEVILTVCADDVCDPNPKCKIIDVTSNQINKGPFPDWILTGDLTLLLRAEIDIFSYEDRIYTITVECTDTDGHSSNSSTQVRVQRSGNRMILRNRRRSYRNFMIRMRGFEPES